MSCGLKPASRAGNLKGDQPQGLPRGSLAALSRLLAERPTKAITGMELQLEPSFDRGMRN